MADQFETGESPLFWSASKLIGAYQSGELSPTEVAEEVINRIELFNSQLNAYITPLNDLARKQAQIAEQAYKSGDAALLSGVPISIKDTFAVAGTRTTYGSYFYRDNIAASDSGLIARLRASGGVFPGKTNTAEFGQSATTDNRLGPDTGNPWDPSRTPGGSSGGAAASVAAGLATIGLGADGGGSIRIPAAFTGLFGFKPTHGLCADENGARAMTEFVCPGPLARSVDDARRFMEVIGAKTLNRRTVPSGLKIAWCSNLENRPVSPAVAEVVQDAAGKLAELGHEVIAAEPPIGDWKSIFGPLVQAVEYEERADLLTRGAEHLTDYERETLEAAQSLSADNVNKARDDLQMTRSRMDGFFDEFDAIVLPTTATTAFKLGQRPLTVDGRPVSEMWGAFPFTPQFNVAGTPGASLPCGLVDGLPVGIQIIAKRDADHFLLDLCADMEEALAFDASLMQQVWSMTSCQSAVS